MIATLTDAPLFASNAVADDLCGDVVCEAIDGHSALTRVWATDPLKLLTPRTHGHARQVVLSTYGGGLLGGDRVAVRARVGAHARLLVTTQSAGKVYRSEGLPSAQQFHAVVEDDALLAVLPDPVCPFAESRFHQRQHYDLSPRGNVVVLDWLTSGRHGRGERWAMQEVNSLTQIDVGGRPLLRETLSLNADHGEIGLPLRVGRFDCYAVLAMIGPLVRPLAEATQAHVRSMSLSQPTLLATDSSVAGGAVFRILGRDVQGVQGLLQRLIEPLAGLLGQSPWGRKW
ncbi:MAG TPA: urease accessory protein UreD [Tepidisphaeraceae bacterium]|jgi:urease accessory protein